MSRSTWAAHRQELLKDEELNCEVAGCAAEFGLARQIIAARIAANLTQTQLAKRAGTSQVVISRLENAAMNPSVNLLKRVAAALGKNVSITFQ
jgi:DNA-binding XRE family transcriptional regulator